MLGFLLAGALCAQSSNKLDSDLLALKTATVDSASRQLASDILSLSNTQAQPSRRSVMDFTDQLARALVNKNLRPNAISELTSAILDILHSDGLLTSKYDASIEQARQALIANGVSAKEAQAVSDQLRVIGQDIRGPEDSPVFPVRPR